MERTWIRALLILRCGRCDAKTEKWADNNRPELWVRMVCEGCGDIYEVKVEAELTEAG